MKTKALQQRWAVPVVCSVVAMLAARQQEGGVVATSVLLGVVWIAWHGLFAWLEARSRAARRGRARL